MIKKTLAFLLVNSCSESSTLVPKTLNLQSSWITLLLTSHKHRTKAQQQTNKQEELRTTHQMKEKLKKSILKNRAHCYGQEGARNKENGARVEKKQISEDLCYKINKRTICFYLF
jgi:hypothetical protein